MNDSLKERVLSICKLTKIYNCRYVLRELSLDVFEGEIVSLKGVNGVGKSTLIECIAGIIRPEGGSISIGKFSQFVQRHRVEVSKLLGASTKELLLYVDLTVIENLKLFSALTGVSLLRVEELIELFNLDSFKDTTLANCSAGVARRVAIARAIIHRPKLLILDEPFANLDKHGREILCRVFREHCANRGAILFATHQDEVIQGITSRHLELEHGAIKGAVQ